MSLSRRHRELDELLARPLAEADLERATRDMATPLDALAATGYGMLLFVCGEEQLAVRASEVAKVVHETPVHRVPHRTSPIFRGLCNHDGELLLCMNLEQALGMPPHTGEQERLLVVVGTGRHRWAFAVDRIVGVVTVTEQAHRPAPVTVSAARTGCVTHLVDTVEGTAAVLDLARLDPLFLGAVS